MHRDFFPVVSANGEIMISTNSRRAQDLVAQNRGVIVDGKLVINHRNGTKLKFFISDDCCVKCKTNLQIHHILPRAFYPYFKLTKKYSNYRFTCVLCENCHALADKIINYMCFKSLSEKSLKLKNDINTEEIIARKHLIEAKRTGFKEPEHITKKNLELANWNISDIPKATLKHNPYVKQINKLLKIENDKVKQQFIDENPGFELKCLLDFVSFVPEFREFFAEIIENEV